MAQIKRSNRRGDLSPVHPDAAAIDIGATMHVAAVSPDRDPEPVQNLRHCHRRVAPVPPATFSRGVGTVDELCAHWTSRRALPAV